MVFHFAAVQNYFLLKGTPKDAAAKAEGQIQFGTRIHRRKDNIKMVLWIGLI